MVDRGKGQGEGASPTFSIDRVRTRRAEAPKINLPKLISRAPPYNASFILTCTSSSVFATDFCCLNVRLSLKSCILIMIKIIFYL